MLIILSAIVVICLVALLIFLLIVSPGRPTPFKADNGEPVIGSICEKVFVKIGGVTQGMFIRGKDLNNPVLLYVHGGPSFSEYFLVEKYPSGLENNFTVCYWEERGGGISYPGVTLESMTLEQLASDVIEVTEYLRSRFKKEKIYLMAHSGGTAFAIRAAANFPQLFYSYTGVSQITSQKESEKLAYKYILDYYQAEGNQAMVAELKKFPVLGDNSFILPFFNSVLRDKTMHALGIGTMHDMRSILTGVFFPVWTCRAYTLREKFNIWYSKFSFVNKSGLRREVLNTDITALVPKLDIPVYFLSGKYDLTVNHTLSKEYLNKLDSPVKGFYTFENSAHSPMFEEPSRFLEVITGDVMNHTTKLADNE